MRVMITTVRNLLLWMFEDTLCNVSNHVHCYLHYFLVCVLGLCFGFVFWVCV